CGNCSTVAFERRLELCERLDRRFGPYRFIVVKHDRVALLLRDLDRSDLIFETARGLSFGSLSMRTERILVLLAASYLILFGNHLARVAHMPILERAPKSVIDHQVNDRLIAHTITVAGTRHRSEEHTSELQSRANLVCRLLL